ncbi:hypothetical protein LAJ19_14845 (plasmid) [Deinococcus taeanensis]|uniref:DinB family protein n=1 Tax=Deinococcus taeanensis TaxID=2737050 RepID=UPI001CDB91B8|nr:DinB family protein [Deinococcus taeanensis]UBV44087.1 hypothetical protein LAJ19_14845 [Deinococcus taeanensis]
MDQWWVGRYGLGTGPYEHQLAEHLPTAMTTHATRAEAATALERPKTLQVTDVAAMRGLFSEVDELVFQAFGRLDQPFEVIRPSGRRTVVTQRWVLIAQMTHEFHHKGQMLACGRAVGSSVPDDTETDLVPPYRHGPRGRYASRFCGRHRTPVDDAQAGSPERRACSPAKQR